MGNGTSLVGRAPEMGRLAAALEQARAGSGSLLFLCGEPGIGKSRLVEETASLAQQQGLAVAWGRTWEAGGAPAFWPWIQVLRALAAREEASALPPRQRAALAVLLPENAEPGLDATLALEPEQARFGLMDAAVAFVSHVARRGPLLIVLEDLHVADTGSLLLLDFIAPQLRFLPVSVVGTYRDGDMARRDRGDAFERLLRLGQHMPLPRLAAHEVAQIAHERRGAPLPEDAARALYEVTEGNPLFVNETLRLAQLSPAGGTTDKPFTVPRTIFATIGKHVEAMPHEVRRALAAGAIVGREFERSALLPLLEVSESPLAVQLAQALDAGLLEEPSPGRHRFCHVLIREWLYQEMTVPERESLHARHAQALDRGRGVSAATLAYHYQRAGHALRDRAMVLTKQAADEAARRFAYPEAAAAWAWILSVLPDEDEAAEADLHARAECLLELGRAEVLAGLRREAREHCRAAAALASVRPAARPRQAP